MATAVMGALRRPRLSAWLNRPATANALSLSLFFAAILLMVLPAELITYEPPERAALNLETTFAELCVAGAAAPRGRAWCPAW